MKYLHNFFYAGIVVVIVSLWAHPFPKPTFVNVTVTDVRLTYQAEATTSSDGDPVTGAAIGGILLGTPGAIVGAGMNSGQSVVLSSHKLVACCIIARLPNGRLVTFRYSCANYSPRKVMEEVTTLRVGDTIRLGQLNPGGKYFWKDDGYGMSEE